MATNYPGSLDTSTQQPSPSASTEMDDSGFEHDVVHANHSGAIIAVETKVGTGASTPVANSVLGGTGSGTSAWTTTPTLGGLTVSGDVAVDTNVLYVDTTNNRVGIGNYPATTLDVQGTINQPWGNAFTQDGVANTKFIDVNFTGGLGNHVDLSVPNNGSAGLGDTVMRLVDGGNIGIGAATPDTLLHVSGSTDTVAHFESTDAEGMIAFSDSASTGNWYDRRIGVHGDDLSFVTNGARRMTILDNGSVGIGTTAPDNVFHVNGGTANFVARFESTDSEVYVGLKDSGSSSGGHVAIAAIGNDLVLRAGDSNAVRVKAHGDVGIGTTSPGQRLHVNSGATNTAAVFESTDTEVILGLKDDTTSGNAHVGIRATGNDLSLRAGNTNQVVIYSGGTAQFAGAVITTDGTAANPGLSFTSDTDTGMFREGANILALATGGTKRVTVGSSGDVTLTGALLAPNGSNSAPSLSFTNDSNTGFYVAGNDGVIRFVGNGTPGGWLSNTGIRTVDGSASVPSYSFTSDSNTGMFRSAADELAFTTAGTQRVTIASDGDVGIGTTSPAAKLHVAGNMQVGTSSTNYKMNLYRQDTGTADHINIYNGSTLVGTIGAEDSTWLRLNQEVAKNIYTPRLFRADGGFQSKDGTGGAPAYTFYNDTNTGIYRVTTDQLGFATGGTLRARFYSNGLLMGSGASTGQAQIGTGTGSASAPVYHFYNDNDTGMYRYDANGIGFACGGVVKASITGHINVHGTDSSLVALDPPTGTGNDAEWVSVFGVYLLRRNSSTAAEKLKIQDDLEGWLTPDMVDSVVPKMWTRDHAPAYPEIGPIADDMDAISPFLGVKGTNENGEQVLTGIDRNAYLSLLVLAVKDLRTRVVELENA